MRLEYAARNKLIRRLGFKSYDDYLNSILWKSIRAAKLEINPECYACGGKATQVHHGRYTLLNLTGGNLFYLVSVCGNCHEMAEFHRSGAKVGPRVATKQLKRMRKRTLEMARQKEMGR